jgi:hypothetical protein
MYELARRQVQTFKKKRVQLTYVVESLRKDFATANPTGFGALAKKEQIEQLKDEPAYLTWDALRSKAPGLPQSQAERLGKKAWGVFDGLTPAELAAQDEEEDAVADPRRELFLDVLKTQAGVKKEGKAGRVSASHLAMSRSGRPVSASLKPSKEFTIERSEDAVLSEATKEHPLSEDIILFEATKEQIEDTVLEEGAASKTTPPKPLAAAPKFATELEERFEKRLLAMEDKVATGMDAVKRIEGAMLLMGSQSCFSMLRAPRV